MWCSDASKGFAAIEEVIVVCGQQEVGVQSEHRHRWPEGDSEAEGAVFGGDLVTDPISDSSDQEVEVEKWYESEIAFRQIGRQNELIDGIEEELLQSVGQYFGGLLDNGFVSRQRVQRMSERSVH